MSNEEIIALPYDANLASFKNIEEIDDGSEASISDLIVTLSFRVSGVVRVQWCTIEGNYPFSITTK